jgi:hypothetical protein
MATMQLNLANESDRTFICIPVGGALGPTTLPVVFGGVVGLAFMSFTMGRWACLEYRWVLFVKI